MTGHTEPADLPDREGIRPPVIDAEAMPVGVIVSDGQSQWRKHADGRWTVAGQCTTAARPATVSEKAVEAAIRADEREKVVQEFRHRVLEGPDARRQGVTDGPNISRLKAVSIVESIARSAGDAGGESDE